MTDTDADDGTTGALTGDDLEYEEFEEEWDWDDGLDMAPEGLHEFFTLAPLIPTRLILPVLDRLGLSVVDALHQSWLEVRSDRCGYNAWSEAWESECSALVEAVLDGGDPGLVTEALRSRAFVGSWLPQRVAEWLDELADPQLAEVAAETYTHENADSAVRHRLARGPLGSAMAGCLLAGDSLPALHLRPLLATGHPEVARRVLALPAKSVTKAEQAQAAMQLLEQGRGEELKEVLHSGQEQGKPSRTSWRNFWRRSLRASRRVPRRPRRRRCVASPKRRAALRGSVG